MLVSCPGWQVTLLATKIQEVYDLALTHSTPWMYNKNWIQRGRRGLVLSFESCSLAQEDKMAQLLRERNVTDYPSCLAVRAEEPVCVFTEHAPLKPRPPSSHSRLPRMNGERK